MVDVVVRAARAGDAAYLAAHMRDQDVAELHAVGERNLLRGVQESIDASTLCWTTEVDSVVATIGGVVPLAGFLGDIGAPWMLGTPAVPRNRRALMRLAPAYIARMQALYPHLVNFVHAENSVAVQWLQRVGFTLQPAVPHGPLGALFHRFDLRA